MQDQYQEEVYSIRVGIDFGTTFSGVAWAHTSKKDEVNVIQSWPQGGRVDSDKVPTEIAYDPSFQPYGYKWGFECKSEPNKISWFKLLLDPSQMKRTPTISPIISRIQKLLPPHKKPVDVVADFLYALERHTKDTLTRTYGEGFIENIKIEYVLTIPAVWSDKAKALTLEAAERAGIGSCGKLQVIAEPEAAAVYSLPSLKPSHNLRIGDTFVVADCGGGTVDLVSYQIAQLEPVLQVQEHAVGGGLCGSTFINSKFMEFLIEQLGQQYLGMGRRGQEHLLNSFDQIKKSFSLSDDQEAYTCPAPGLEDDEEAGIECGLLILKKERVQAIFDPVINEVLSLIQEQVRIVEERRGGEVSAILLVGGFGSSEYLRERLSTDIKTRFQRSKIPILRPNNSWTAVVRGAVLRSLEGPIVTTRLSRRNYGVLILVPYVEGIHPIADKYWDEFEGTWRRKVVKWCMKKDTEFKENEEIKFSFCRSLPMDYSKHFDTTIYACDSADPPITLSDESIYKFCTLEGNITNVPQEYFQLCNNYEKQYRRLSFSISMNIKSAQLVFSLEVDGAKYGAVAATFH